LTEEGTPKSNLKHGAPEKLINEATDDMPETERTAYNIIKEEEKSLEIISQ